MALTIKKLKKLLKEAYESGYAGSLDMADSYTDDVLSSLFTQQEKLTTNDGWETYTVKQLRNLTVGTILEHSSRGKCWIDSNRTETFMKFWDGSVSKFYTDDAPWNEPLRIIKLQTPQFNTTHY